MAEWSESTQIRSRRQSISSSNPKEHINILLLGETGVGKTTFINAFANYLTYDTLDEALQGQMQVLIPSPFSITDPETYTTTTITLGSGDDNELCEDNGQSLTQGCKSYVFPIGRRYLRLIDTPGIGDTRGVPQDNINFDHIVSFISCYEHLNGICILLKPNNHRLNISFRYTIKELLKHLNVSAKNNIMFVFTNARSSFFMPGATCKQLRILLDQLKSSSSFDVPFSKDNSFFFDNESFRYLAVCKDGHNFLDENKPNFIDSWNKSVAELNRMITRILTCGKHSIQDMKSLNEAQQLIKKLTRPIGEVATLLEENIQLAEKHKRKIEANAYDTTANRIPEKIAEVISLDYPRLICASSKCSKATKIDGEMKIDYKVQCHKRCELRGVEQEVINNPIIKQCRKIDQMTGKCKICHCDWSKHMHVTYEFRKRLNYLEDHDKKSSRSSERILARIDRRIKALKQEQEIICHICAKLTVFLHMNAINPTNDDVIEYINHFIREEKEKLNAGDDNQQIILGLENLIKEYQNEIKLLKEHFNNQTDKNDPPTINDIFVCKIQLCELEIAGKYIKEQLENLESNQMNMIEKREEYVQLPENAKKSTNMQVLEQVVA